MTPSLRRILWINFAVLVGLFMILTILRLNYPMKGMMLVEEWDLPYIIEKGSPPLLPYTQQTFTTRPLLMLGAFLGGYLLTPGSYVGMNFILLMSMFISSAAIYSSLVRLLPNWHLGAFLVAALFLVHPADEYLYTLRSMANHVALAMWLIAVRLLLAYFDKPTRLRLALLWLTTFVSLLTYETGYPLMLATAVLPLLLERRLSRRVVGVTTLFGIGIAITAGITLILYLSVPKPYVEQLLAPSGNLLSVSSLTAIATDGLRMLRRAFYDGWLLAFSRSATQLPLLLVTVVAVWVAGRGIMKFAVSDDKLTRQRFKTMLFVMLGGLFIFGLGVLPYLLAVSHRGLNERVYYYASVGASLTFIMAVYLIVRLLRGGQMLFAVIGGVAIGLGMVQVVSQLDQLKGYYLTQQRFLTQFAEQVPALAQGTDVVVIDDTGKFQSTYWLFNVSFRLETILSYLYQDYSIHAYLCYPQLQIWGSGFEHCSFEAGGLLSQAGIATTNLMPLVKRYDKMIIFRYTTNEQLVLLKAVPNNDNSGTLDVPTYHPENHIRRDVAPNVRVKQLLLSEVPPAVETVVDAYRVDVGDPVPDGMGWFYGPATLPDGTTWRWTIAKRVDMLIPPLKSGAYTVKLRVLNLLPNTVWKTVKFAMNNTVVPTTYQLDSNGNFIYTGEISANLVHPETVNDLEIRVDDLFLTPGLDIKLGLAVDWVEVTRKN